MPTASVTAFVMGRSKPALVPSASMEVRRISPAPRASPLFTQSSRSRPVGFRPPATTTSQVPSPRLRASTASTTHWEPNRSAASVISSGRATAAELTEILSAPARSSSRKSSRVRMPPPTVRGTNTCSAVRSTTSATVLRASWVAVMSKKTISSAPWSE